MFPRQRDDVAIQSPTLLLDGVTIRRNLAATLAKTKRDNIQFRPHVKTHQHAWITPMMQETRDHRHYGQQSSIWRNDSSIRGGEDVTLALPVNPRQVDRLAALSQKARLGIILDHPETLRCLVDHPTGQWPVWIEMDCGDGRTGVPLAQPALVQQLALEIQATPHLELAGILTHAGHTYGQTPAQVRQLWTSTLADLQSVRDVLPGRSKLPISVGDTPTTCLVESLSGIQEVRAGNLVYFDLMQHQQGSCTLHDIGALLIAPVIGRYPERSEIVIHGGAVHLSKEGLTDHTGRHYGRPVRLTGQGWQQMHPNSCVRAISQEHGIVRLQPEEVADFQIGDLIGVLPVHSCLMADLMKGQPWLLIEPD